MALSFLCKFMEQLFQLITGLINERLGARRAGCTKLDSLKKTLSVCNYGRSLSLLIHVLQLVSLGLGLPHFPSCPICPCIFSCGYIFFLWLKSNSKVSLVAIGVSFYPVFITQPLFIFYHWLWQDGCLWNVKGIRCTASLSTVLHLLYSCVDFHIAWNARVVHETFNMNVMDCLNLIWEIKWILNFNLIDLWILRLMHRANMYRDGVRLNPSDEFDCPSIFAITLIVKRQF